MVSKAFILGDRISQDRASCNYVITTIQKVPDTVKSIFKQAGINPKEK